MTLALRHSALGCLLAFATAVSNTALAQNVSIIAPAPAESEVIGSPDTYESTGEELPAIDWNRVNIDAYDLTRSMKARDIRRNGNTNAPVWDRTENRNGSANVTVKRSLPTALDTKVGVDMVISPSSSAITLPGAQQQASSGAAWASTALPSFGPWWDQASVNARLDPIADQGRLGTSVSKSMPLNEQMSLTLQSGLGVSQTLASSSLGSAPAHMVEADRSAKLSWTPTGTSFIAGSKLSSNDDRWLNSFGAEQNLFGGISVRGTVSETTTGVHDHSLTAGFKRSW
ncbi:hypothetical protein [Pseudorhodoplanes sinuspersici]|nr:hypothetical protein [Pseudorhodoplanes sinuspersici]RKE67729.1 hypothetical protein DFP91_5499 [Pseudorhodoplanes sinuspersici]